MKFEQWEITGYDRPTAAAMCREGINPLVALSLCSRGVGTAVEAREYLRSDCGLIHDPMLMLGMPEAVERLHIAIEAREHIAVFGDYDVDGMTASCLTASYFRSKGLECDIYIPGRLEEGYGVNALALDELAEKGVTLIITVDCGITAVEETEYAKRLGLELIITDHHECKETLPDAVAVIDPKRNGCPYPNKSLSGVGVAFKLVCAVEGGNIEPLIEEYCDLVAIGTVADVMLMRGENRALVSRGLDILNRRERPGLKSLMNESGLSERDITSATIGFALSPRLNAAGRMSRTSLTVQLLLTRDAAEARTLAGELCTLNCERRSIETEILGEALELLDGKPIGGMIVLARENWFQGVLGIVATRLAERFYVPVILISTDSGEGRGSCRSFAGFPIYEALNACSDLLTNFGGHEMAAGLTIPAGNIPELTRRVNEFYHKRVKHPPVPTLKIDFEAVKPGLMTLENVTALMSMEPYGHGNMPPTLCIKRATLQACTSVGGGLHTRVRLVKSGESFDGIMFSRPVEELGVQAGELVDAAFNVQINQFRGRRSVQLLLKDIRPHID